VRFTEAYYLGCSVVVLPPISITNDEKGGCIWREKGSKYQYPIKGRVHKASGSRQIAVDNILSEWGE
jgi:hypothetical protein